MLLLPRERKLRNVRKGVLPALLGDDGLAPGLGMVGLPLTDGYRPAGGTRPKLEDGSALGPDDDVAEIVLRKLFKDARTSITESGAGGEGDSASTVLPHDGDRSSSSSDPLDILGNELLNGFPTMGLNDLEESATCE